MPSTAVTSGGTAQQRTNGSSGQKTVAVVPFIRASAEHYEPTGIDVSRQLTTSTQDLGVFDIPAYGYARALVIEVNASGGTGGAPAVTPDADSPFNTLVNIALTEPNGAEITRFSSGYGLFLAHKWGGYRKGLGADGRAWNTNYTAVPANGSAWNYMLRIPIELSGRDGLGALPNQNAAATFKLRLTLNSNTGIGSGTWPTTLPTVRVRVYLEAWDQPETAAQGQTNQVNPPAMNTTQFWTEQIYNYNAGQQTIPLKRVGNYIRNLVLVARRTAGTRANGDSDFPDPISLYLDTRPISILQKSHFKQLMMERSGFGMNEGGAPAADSAGGLDNGVFVYDYTHEFDGTLGYENRDLWLPTQSSSRLELQGNFAQAGTLTVYTNDVAIAAPVFL